MFLEDLVRIYTYHEVSGQRGSSREEGIGEQLRSEPGV